MKLAGKIVVITGAANGLGKALVQESSSHQAQVVAVDVDKIGLASLQNELPDIMTIAADVADANELSKALEDTLKIHSQLDVWINNAGIMAADGPAIKQSGEGIRRAFEVNTLAMIDGSILVANYFSERPGGWIVNILSSTALEIVPGRSIYSATKHAGHAFTQALKLELAGVKVLAVYPDGIKTQLFGDSDEPNYDQFMTGAHVAQKIIAAIQTDNASDLVIKR